METSEPERKDDEEMKRTLAWFVGAVLVSVGLVVALQAQERGTAPSTSEPPTAQAEKIAYTFTSDAEMENYTKMLQERQGILIRMQVLQQYFGTEQSNLRTINEDIIATYKLDGTKAYFLDPARKVLLEQEAPPAPEAAQQAPAGAGTAAKKP